MTLSTRRTALALLASAAIPLGVMSRASVQAAAGLRLRSIAIDTSRLAALGNPVGADAVRQALGRDLRQVFGDLIASRGANGATLLVRISSLSLSSYVGTRSFGRRNGGNNMDYLEGVGIVSTDGRTVSETPILSALDAGYSGAWYLPNIDEMRVASISYHFVYWLRREMGV